MDIMQDTMLSKIQQALAPLTQKKVFYAWRIDRTDSVALQSLLLGKKDAEFEEYQARKVFDQSYEVTLYSRQDEDGEQTMGNATCTIDPLADLEQQLEKTFQHSLLVNNKAWDLPNRVNEAYEAVVTSDPLIKENTEQAHQGLLATVNETAKTLTTVTVNSGELFTRFSRHFFQTSFGLTGTKESSRIYFEIALEKRTLPNTQEVLKHKKSINVAEAKLDQFIHETVDEVLSIRESILPTTSNNATILIDAEAIAQLLSPLMGQLDADNEYSKRPFIAADSMIYQHEKSSDSDKLTVTLDPNLPLMGLSTPFTAEGMKPQKARIIVDDKVMCQRVDHKMAQYLNKTANYIQGNRVVAEGSLTKAELLTLKPECIEILAFSSLLVNYNTLTWSSEIKLGRLYKDGKAVAMLKGGVVSGNIRENLADFRFSDAVEKRASQGYLGPRYMLINAGVKIAGEES